jgi:hypothetical protein
MIKVDIKINITKEGFSRVVQETLDKNEELVISKVSKKAERIKKRLIREIRAKNIPNESIESYIKNNIKEENATTTVTKVGRNKYNISISYNDFSVREDQQLFLMSDSDIDDFLDQESNLSLLSSLFSN